MSATLRLEPGLRRAIQSAAIRLLSKEQLRRASLFFDDRVLGRGTVLGPEYEGIRVKSDRATLVFVDDHPQANFGHECHYLLFHPETATLLESYEARFPPFPRGWPRDYKRFDGHRPRPTGIVWRTFSHTVLMPLRRFRALLRAGSPRDDAMPVAKAAGRKFALLFAGTPDPCHLNTMEFAYRVLCQLEFSPGNIIVCSYNGASPPTCPEWGETNPGYSWPGDGNDFQMPVDHRGTQSGFEAAIGKLKQMQPGQDDLLFIFTSGHGSGMPGTGPDDVFLDTKDGQYTTSLFRESLLLFQDGQTEVPAFGKLIVLMGQCCADGFKDAVLDSGIASSSAFAAAAKWNGMSFNDGFNEGNYTWNCFPKDWLAAQIGEYYDKAPLVRIVDTLPESAPDQRISAKEAFDYAAASPPKHPGDQPREGYSTATAGEQLMLEGS